MRHVLSNKEPCAPIILGAYAPTNWVRERERERENERERERGRGGGGGGTHV